MVTTFQSGYFFIGYVFLTSPNFFQVVTLFEWLIGIPFFKNTIFRVLSFFDCLISFRIVTFFQVTIFFGLNISRWVVSIPKLPFQTQPNKIKNDALTTQNDIVVSFFLASITGHAYWLSIFICYFFFCIFHLNIITSRMMFHNKKKYVKEFLCKKLTKQ